MYEYHVNAKSELSKQSWLEFRNKATPLSVYVGFEHPLDRLFIVFILTKGRQAVTRNDSVHHHM